MKIQRNPIDVVTTPGENTWEDRVKKWYKPMTLQERETWLRSNWTRIDNGPDIFIFYLDLAHGYGDNVKTVDFKTSDGVYCVRTDIIHPCEVTTFIRQTAFSVLANHFFKKENDNYPFDLPYSEPLFSHLVDFFKPYNGIGGFDNLRPSSKKFLGRDGGVHYVDNAYGYAHSFAGNAFLMLNGLNPFPFSEGSSIDFSVAQSRKVDIVSLARRFGIFEYQKTLGLKTLRVDLFCLLYRIMFAECGERVIVDRHTISSDMIEGPLRRCVQRRHDLAVFLNTARFTMNATD